MHVCVCVCVALWQVISIIHINAVVKNPYSRESFLYAQFWQIGVILGYEFVMTLRQADMYVWYLSQYLEWKKLFQPILNMSSLETNVHTDFKL